MSARSRNWIWLGLLAAVLGLAGFSSRSLRSLASGWTDRGDAIGLAQPVGTQAADLHSSAATRQAATTAQAGDPTFHEDQCQSTSADAAAPAEESEHFLLGRVVRVTSGSSLTIASSDEHGGQSHHRVRLRGIDAPKDEEFRRAAKEMLASMVLDRQVEVRWSQRDRHDRLLGEVLVNGCWVNARMVHYGLAKHATRFSDNNQLAAAEEFARTNRLGIWIVADKTVPQQIPAVASGVYWLNTASGVRHNESCRWFGKSKKGRECGASEGRPCHHCGG